jgi:hypothetical protein
MVVAEEGRTVPLRTKNKYCWRPRWRRESPLNAVIELKAEALTVLSVLAAANPLNTTGTNSNETETE